MRTQVKVAIVGAGNMATEHARAFGAIDGVEIVGVHGKSAERARLLSASCGAPTFSSIAEMYETARPDALVIAVNELSIRSVCREAFAYPWVCLLEKPVGLNYSEALEIEQDANDRNARVFVALNRRSYEATRHVVDQLRGDGSTRLISVLDQQDTRHARTLGKPESVLTNYMYANSIHLIDYLTLFCRGKVVSVRSTPYVGESAVVAAIVEFESGDVGTYQCVWNRPGPWSVSVTSSSFRFEMRPLEGVSVQKLGERRVEGVELSGIDVKFKPGLYHQACEMVAFVRGGTPKSVPTLSEGVDSMRLCAAIYGHLPEC